jgi:hypothetical protein
MWANLPAALLLSGCATSSASAKDYQGPDFTIHLPAATTFCMNKPPAPDHGFVALLRSDDCGHVHRLERLELILSDMPLNPTDTPDSITGNICYTGQAKGAGFVSGGTPVYQCLDSGEIGGLAYRQYFLLRKDATGQARGPVLIVFAFSQRDTLNVDAEAAERVIAQIDWR